MANLVYSITLTPNTTASATDVESKFSDVKTWLNNRDNSSDSWLTLKVTGATILNSTLSASGAVSFTSTLAVTGALTQTGAATFNAGITQSASNAITTINSTSSYGALAFQLAGTAKAFIGVSSTTDDVIIGSAAGDVVFRTQGGNILFSVDSGVTAKVKINTNGNLIIATGSAGTPSLGFSAHSTTGFFDSGGDPQLSIAGTASYGWNSAAFYPVVNGGVGLGTSGFRFASSFIATLTLSNALGTASGGTGKTSKIMATGTYTGNGAGRTIAHGLGATPSLALIIQTDSSTGVAQVWWSSDFAAQSGGARRTTGEFDLTTITAVDGTNLTLGTDVRVNNNTSKYQFFVWLGQ